MRNSEARDSSCDAARIELILYVSAASPASARAVANVRRLLRQYQSGQVSLTVCDLELLEFYGVETAHGDR